jgi:predicted nucleic acid-binding protein
MRFIDTNIFIRYLTRDDPAKAERVKQLLERTQRGEVAFDTEVYSYDGHFDGVSGIRRLEP